MAIPRGDAADPRDGSADAQSDEDASETPEPSRFVTTALVSSSVVTHAVRGRFRAPGELALVLGKRDQLLLFAPDEEGGGEAMRLERQQSARGTLVALKVARGGGRGYGAADAREGEDTRARDSRADVDTLVALSDSGELSVLRYDAETRRFARVRSARLGPPGMRRVAPGVASRTAPLAEFDRIAVDPASGAIAVSCENRACVFFGLLRNEPNEPRDRGAPLRREGGVILGTAFAEALGRVPGANDASATRARRPPARRFVALAVLARDREDEARIIEARRGVARDAPGDAPGDDDGNAAVEGAEDGTRGIPRETREARRLREIREFGLGRDRPRRLRPPGVRLPLASVSAADAVAPRARPDADCGASAGSAPTRLDVFYGSAAFGETASSDDAARFSSPPACVVVFDDDVRAALGERACLVDPRVDRGEAAPEPSGTERSVRFLVLGEFGAVEVSAPGAEKAEKGEARVVARAAPGETWVPRCHAWRAPRSPAERWSVAVACRRRGDGETRDDDALPCVRTALAVDRETGAATSFRVALDADDANDANDGTDDAANARGECEPLPSRHLDVGEPSPSPSRPSSSRHDARSRRWSAAPTAMLPLGDGETTIVFAADGSAAARAVDASRTPSEASAELAYKKSVRYARDAVSLVSLALASHASHASAALRGELERLRAPPLAPVDGFAPAGARGDDGSFLLTAGGAPSRVTLGVAAEVTTVSPPGFGGVTSMWAPDDATLVLGFTDATRVFRVATEASASASASFAEAESGLGFALDEPTAACGAFRVNAFFSGARRRGPGAQGGMVQVTAARARLCAHGALVSEWVPGTGDGVVGAAAVAPHGRVAVSLPRVGTVKLLAPMATRDVHAAETLQLLPVSIVRFAHEPSCLTLPDPETGASFLGAVKSDAITAGDVRAGAVTVLVAGTYAREVIAVAARETRGSVATRAFASEVFRSEIELRPEESSTAPAAMRVAFGDAERAPVLLVATRGGDLLVVEAGGGIGLNAARANRKRRLATTTATATATTTPGLAGFSEATPRRPPRLVGFGNGAADHDRDPPVIRVGVDSAASAAEMSKRSPLGDMFVSPKPERFGESAPRASESVPVDSGDAEMETRDLQTCAEKSPNEKSGMRVISTRRLGNAPLAFLEPRIADASAGAPVLVTGAAGAWLARGVEGAQRVSVTRVDAPPARAVVAFGLGARGPPWRSECSVLAAIGDRLKAVDVDVDQADAAHRRRDPASGAPRGASRGPEGPLVRFACRDSATGAAVAATEPDTLGGALDVVAWLPRGGAAEGAHENEDEDEAGAGREASAEETAEPPEPLGERLPNAPVAFEAPDGTDGDFRAVALASCLAEDGSCVLVVGARGVAKGRARRAFDGAGDADPAVEGRVLFLRRVSGQRAEERTFPFALAATAAFPDAVTCVSAAGPGLVLVGTAAGAHVLRVETRPRDGASRRERERDGAPETETNEADEAEDPCSLVSGSLRVWLAARLATRRPVLALAAGEPEFPFRRTCDTDRTSEGTAEDRDSPEHSAAGPRNGPETRDGSARAPLAGSERAMVEAMLFPGARAPERRRVVPIAVSVARDGVSLCAYIAGGGFFETDRRRRIAPRAADPETRDAVSVALRRRGEVAGVDAQGRVFVLRRGALFGAGDRTPESNLRLAARFDLCGATPVAVLVRGSRHDTEEETREDTRREKEKTRKTKNVSFSKNEKEPEPSRAFPSACAADRATLFDAADARRAFGPSFAVATDTGGVFAVSEVSEADWQVLARAQRALDAHPATAPPLGFAFRREDGDGFADRSPAGEEVRPKRYAALDAARRASAPAPPAVLDGTLLRELLELPEKTQREVLTFGAEGAGTAEATLETARRVLETVLFSFL